MSKTKIFVSSTCYDLSQIREDIKNCILDLGHEPYLSEYPSFPVIPDLTTIQNCKRNIKESTDIFILIVGGRYGSQDKDEEKSITNIEYDESKMNGIESLIFVDQTIFDILRLWETNPTADFNQYVDSIEVFKFIKGILNEQKWIFKFQKASDITNILKEQLSFYLKYLIDKKRGNRLEPLSEFLDESPRAQMIVSEKREYWNILLTEELLRTKLSLVREKFDDLFNGVYSRKYIRIDEDSFKGTKIIALSSFLHMFKTLLEKLPHYSCDLGTQSNPIEIKKYIDKIILGCQQLFEWEVDMKYEIPPERYLKLNELLCGCAFEIFSQIEKIPDKLIEPFKIPNPTGTYEINLKINPITRETEIYEEIERIKNI